MKDFHHISIVVQKLFARPLRILINKPVDKISCTVYVSVYVH